MEIFKTPINKTLNRKQSEIALDKCWVILEPAWCDDVSIGAPMFLHLKYDKICMRCKITRIEKISAKEYRVFFGVQKIRYSTDDPTTTSSLLHTFMET